MAREKLTQRQAPETPSRRAAGIESLRQVLVQRRAALQAFLDQVPEASGSGGDLIDEAEGTQARELDAQLREVEAGEMQKIDAALRRIAEKTYGLCAECCTKIPMERLNGLPYAERCIKCQRENESERPHEPTSQAFREALGGAVDEDLPTADVIR